MPHEATLLTLAQAWQRIQLLPQCPELIDIPIAQAVGHVLAKDIIATADYPAHTIAAMDGYAFIGGDQAQSLKLIGRAEAGKPYMGAPLQPDECVRIFTGAIIPAGCNSVAMQEDCHNQTSTEPIIINVPACRSGTFIRPQGGDVSAGICLKVSGQRISSRDIAVALACGVDQVRVCRPMRVSVLATGSELRPSGQTASTKYSTINTNMPAIAAALKDHAVKINNLGIAMDETEALRDAIQRALTEAEKPDLLILSGGVSVGDKDLVRQVLEICGIKIIFHGLLVKPGKPSLLAKLGNTLVLGLPGNPVSAMVGTYLLAQPILRHLSGQDDIAPASHTVRCTTPLPAGAKRQNFLRGIVTHDADGQLWVRALQHQDSAALYALAQANCLISIDINATARSIHDTVPIYLF